MFSLSVWHILIQLLPIFQSQVEVQEETKYSGSGIFRSWYKLGLLLCIKRYDPTEEVLVLHYSSLLLLGIFLLEYNCFTMFVSFPVQWSESAIGILYFLPLGSRPCSQSPPL